MGSHFEVGVCPRKGPEGPPPLYPVGPSPPDRLPSNQTGSKLLQDGTDNLRLRRREISVKMSPFPSLGFPKCCFPELAHFSILALHMRTAWLCSSELSERSCRHSTFPSISECALPKHEGVLYNHSIAIRNEQCYWLCWELSPLAESGAIRMQCLALA